MALATDVRPRIGIIACEILKREIEMLTKDDPDFVHREYLEFALHIDSAVLKEKVTEKVNSLKGKVDAVLLGYAVCQSLKGVTKQLSVPTVMLDSDDCIGVLITPEEYEREKRVCTGTWFSSPGWAELGFDGAVKELHLDVMRAEGYEPIYFLKMLFEGYKRSLYIDTGTGEKEKYMEKAKDFAYQLNLRHEERASNLRELTKAIAKVKELARKECVKASAVLETVESTA
ncbi:MAG: DUF1638 domain-containing protein [Methanomassiliicoccales archaeon]|jgi:hypothetical protein